MSDTKLKEPITCAKWLSESEIVVGTVNGNLYLVVLKEDGQKALYLERPRLLTQAAYESAIWSIDVDRVGDDAFVYMADDNGLVTCV